MSHQSESGQKGTCQSDSRGRINPTAGEAKSILIMQRKDDGEQVLARDDMVSGRPVFVIACLTKLIPYVSPRCKCELSVFVCPWFVPYQNKIPASLPMKSMCLEPSTVHHNSKLTLARSQLPAFNPNPFALFKHSWLAHGVSISRGDLSVFKVSHTTSIRVSPVSLSCVSIQVGSESVTRENSSATSVATAPPFTTTRPRLGPPRTRHLVALPSNVTMPTLLCKDYTSPITQLT
jgi:hypothetical protein